MCDLCNGMSTEQVRARTTQNIARYGWTMQGVEGSPTNVPWVYTIGLVEHFDHPELILAGMDHDDAASIVGSLADYVAKGGRVEPDEIALVAGVHVSFVAVHPAQFEYDVFARWIDHYRHGGRHELRALQITFPHANAEVRDRTPRLDLPAPALSSTRPGRADRRPARDHRRRWSRQDHRRTRPRR